MNPASALTGSQLYTLVTSILNGFGMDTVLFYQLLSVARTNREMMRPFMALRKLYNSQTIGPVSNLPLVAQNPIPLPSDFLYQNDDGKIVLYDNNNTYENYSQIRQDMYVQFLQVSNFYWIDQAAQYIYFCGIIDRMYYVYMFYQADYGDITANTSWINIPSRFHYILALDVAVLWLRGINYDDISSRNADQLEKQAAIIWDAMCRWDDYLQRSATTRVDYSEDITDGGGFHNHKINVNGD